jgi:hypothetical protein
MPRPANEISLEELYEQLPRRRQQPEMRFLGGVKRYAIRGGWLAFHNLRARGSDPGFLDLLLIRPPRLVVAELKVEGRKLTEWQTVWTLYWQTLAMLAGPHLSIEVYRWEPDDWPDIERVLA